MKNNKIILFIIASTAFISILLLILFLLNLEKSLLGLILTFVVFLNITLYVLIKKYFNYTKENTINLENDVENLKKKITQQEEYIRKQNEEIKNQFNTLTHQQRTIENQKKELEDSIHYAFRIQQAILPPKHFIDQLLSDYFILYIPKAIVSGDFYFIEKEKDYTIVAAVDCTGHGVPGAMMSVIGYDLLNQAVKINHITKPSEILSFIDNGVSTFLRQIGDESGIHDGMDISILSIHKQLRIVEFAGAYHKLYYTHNNTIYEIKGDSLPIGNNFDGVVDQYTNHGVPVSKGDMLYLFSDGFADQFGGNDNKKYKYNKLKNFFFNIHQQPVDIQKELLAKEYINWKNQNEQIDDILIIGIRVE